MEDIRWVQRFNNFKKALDLLDEAVILRFEKGLTSLEEQGIIQRFEFTHELVWNLFKDYFEFQGILNINGSRDATREAFKFGLITDGEIWMEMLLSRNRSSHTYNEEIAKGLVEKICEFYILEYKKIRLSFENKLNEKI